MNLEGRTALVTGSGRGLGRAVALALAQAGADLVVTARTIAEIEKTANEIETMGRRALAFRADITVVDEVNEVIRQTVELFGRINILVNSAGIMIAKPLEEMTLEEWRTIMETNLTSLFLCCKAVGPHMIAQKQGKIINLSAIEGKRGRADWVAYGASKGGVIQFTRALAVEWAKYNIQVNAIGPGVFDTRLMAGSVDDEKRRLSRREKIPLAREGRPEEVGPLVVYLASSASDFITGQTIFIDGGELARL
jgi:NAD(P)-dependent dehydrogenase (short-subunit alcohol dehydrogenase family)